MRFIDRKNIKRTIFAVLSLIFISMAACDSMPRECLSQLDRPFKMAVEGEIDGESVSAEIFCDPTEHKTKEIYDKLTVTFLSPESLDGITVTLRSDGKATVRLGAYTEELPLYSGLVEPFAMLCQSTAPYSVKKTERGFEAEFRSGDDFIKYYFNSKGIIAAVEGEASGRKMSLNVTKFQQIQK